MSAEILVLVKKKKKVQIILQNTSSVSLTCCPFNPMNKDHCTHYHDGFCGISSVSLWVW